MSEHIEVVKKAIEFGSPKYLPLEITDVPGIYNAYWTLDPDTVKLIPGTEDFDSIWTVGFWFPKEIGKNDEGEVIRKDQYGVVSKIPHDTNSTYVILTEPLKGKKSLTGYNFPIAENDAPYFKTLQQKIDSKYKDRFINGHIDPGAFLVASFLLGTEEFYIKTATEIDFVSEVIEGIFEYHYSLIPYFASAGCHMLTYLDEFAGSNGMIINPNIWRKYFKKYYSLFFKKTHEAGMYSGICLDGDFSEILDDLLEMEIDVIQCAETRAIGIDTLKDKVKTRRCIKCGVDMMHTLSLGTSKDVRREAIELVENLNTKEGGFISVAVKWHRPSYPEKNALASVKAFNTYRR